MTNDTISDMLTRLRNSTLVKKRTVLIPYTGVNIKIMEILEKEGYINSFEIRNSYQNTNQLYSKMIENKESYIPKMLKVYLKYYKKYKTKYYGTKRTLKNQKAFSAFKNLIKLLRGKQGRQKASCISNLKRISRPGLRIYANHKDLPKVLGGTGIVILSTSKGMMTDREARFRGIGGEVVCTVW